MLQQQFEALVTEMQSPVGFTPQALNVAASWSLQNNYRLDKGLEWATLATSPGFPGDPTFFPAQVTKAAILEKAGRTAASDSVIRAALPLGNVTQLQQLGRQLLTAKRLPMAMETYQYNVKKYPGQFASLMGMVRGLSASGEHKKALDFAKRALLVAPNNANKQAVQAMIDQLKAGKDIN